MSGATVSGAIRERRTPDWAVVASQELRDLWIRGRGLPLTIAFSILLGVIAYLTATDQALNFLEQREAVSLTLQVAIAVGSLLALLAAADAISGERERGTLESLLLTPVSRRDLAIGKLLAALSLWAAAFATTIPYVWYLGRGVGLVGVGLAAGLVVGTLVAVTLTSLGLLVSTFSRTTGSASRSRSSCCLHSSRRRSSPRARSAGGWGTSCPRESGQRRRALRRLASRAGPRLESGHLVALRASRRGGRGPRRRRLGLRPLHRAPRRRRLVRPLATAIAAAFVLAQAAAAHAQDAGGRLEVQLSRAHVSTELGGDFTFTSTVVNRGTTPAEGLIAHLNVLSLRPGVKSTPRTGRASAHATSVPSRPGAAPDYWHVQAVNVGSFGVTSLCSRAGAPAADDWPHPRAGRRRAGHAGLRRHPASSSAFRAARAAGSRLAATRARGATVPRRTAGDAAT